MVLVPPDAAIRLRAQVESELRAPVQQLQPTRGVPADLPQLQKGQTFTAQIREALPDNTYRALVAGRQLTLQLPEGAKAGDELELVVVDRSGKVVIARQAEGGNAHNPSTGNAAPYPFARFSATARLISQLLPAEGEAAPPALLNRGQPLMAQPPVAQNAAALLAPALGKAVAYSGLFYESHQAQWVNGKRTLEQLLQEPQGRHVAPPALPQVAKIGTGGTTPGTASEPTTAANTGTTRETAPPSAAPPVRQIPDDLRPLVQQQLEAAASHRVFWHGEAWPRQALDWEIEWEGERASEGGEEDSRWRTALSLAMPRLGQVIANLQLTARGVDVTLAASSARSADDLRAAAPALADALARAGVPLLGFTVKADREHPAGQG